MANMNKKDSSFYLIKGYPGLTNMAKYIMPYIPTSKVYVEPFAGLGRTVEFRHDKIILNDMSDYAINYLKNEYGEYSETCEFPIIITQEDFKQCILRWDSEETFFLIDPPWRKNIYKNNEKPFSDKTPIQYYDMLLNHILPNVKGNWILCVDRDEHEIGKRVSKSIYNNLVIQHPTVKLFGKSVAVRLCSNKEFKIE
jgi:site-specific DNA-adenine methylase